MGTADSTSSRESSAIIQTIKSIYTKQGRGKTCPCMSQLALVLPLIGRQNSANFFNSAKRNKVNANGFLLLGGHLFKMQSVVFDFNIT